MKNRRRLRQTLLIAAIIGGLAMFFNSCGKPETGITITGNPVTSLSVAAYQNQTGGTSLNSLNLCLSQILLTPTDPKAPVVQVGFDSVEEYALPAEGATLQALLIPQGDYSQIQIALKDACGTQRSIGIVNSQGTFNSPESVSLAFVGQITVGLYPIKMTFNIQAIVDNLSQVNSNTNVPTAATAATGSVTMANIWTGATLLANAPSPRDHGMMVWTGTKAVMWGGNNNGTWLDTGGQYDPATDSWTPTSTGANAPTARFESAYVWTGSELIIWSGQTLGTDGSRYNPATDTWAAMSTAGAPPPRHSPATVWTGTEMLVWGGTDGSHPIKSGGRYNPGTDTWSAMATIGAPPAAAFEDHMTAAVWTGTEMLVWGGEGLAGFTNTGGRYNPTTNSWSPIPTSGAPIARKNFTPIWTGTELIIWGGYNGDPYNDGARYNPATNTWTVMTLVNAPPPTDSYSAVWTGSQMLVFGGNVNNSNDTKALWSYDPNSDTWVTLSSVNAPSARWLPSTVWTGSTMIVWGGSTTGSAPSFNNGGIFVP